MCHIKIFEASLSTPISQDSDLIHFFYSHSIFLSLSLGEDCEAFFSVLSLSFLSIEIHSFIIFSDSAFFSFSHLPTSVAFHSNSLVFKNIHTHTLSLVCIWPNDFVLALTTRKSQIWWSMTTLPPTVAVGHKSELSKRCCCCEGRYNNSYLRIHLKLIKNIFYFALNQYMNMTKTIRAIKLIFYFSLDRTVVKGATSYHTRPNFYLVSKLY